MSERRYNNTYPPQDKESVLHDGAAAVTSSAAGAVDSSAKIIDFGEDVFRSGGDGADGQAPFVSADMVIHLTALTKANNEFYNVVFQLSDTEDFSSGSPKIVNRAIKRFAHGSALLGGATVAEAGEAGKRYVLSVDNEDGDRTYRYGRVMFVNGGSAPSITCKVALHKPYRRP